MAYKQRRQKKKFNSYGERVYAVGQADDLISDSGTRRVWRSRIDNSLSEEKLVNGRWEMVD